MRLAPYALMCLFPLALWILVSGLDDLFITLVYLFTRGKPFPWPSDFELECLAERRIAILVPLWREDRVIQQMLEHNLAAIRYSTYDIFVGVYRNDEGTLRVVEEVALWNPSVHLVVVPHDGPTSKGDCLNSIYRGMTRYEELYGVRFDVVMTHDAEDLIDPDSLRLVNWFSRDYAMVQMPVLPLPTPTREFTHGLYCDEFAEFQSKDIPVRQILGGFLPANGVGTGFGRAALDHLAELHGGRIFDPGCLTEDYENGFRLHALGYRQIFLPVRRKDGRIVATREYFPRNFRGAARQRSRWVAGIALQSWQTHGWRAGTRQAYWFWRDRKGLVGNLLSPLANILWLGAIVGYRITIPSWFLELCRVVCGITFIQIGVRAACGARLYGWGFALASPVRTVWGNVINCRATAAAIRQFIAACCQGTALVWRKTEHVYPRPRLGEVLVRMRLVSMGDLEEALMDLSEGQKIGDYLVQKQKLSEVNLYRALGLQSGLPMGQVGARHADWAAVRTIPAAVSRRWNVVPYRLENGRLHVATADIPSRELSQALSALTPLEIHYRLMRASQLRELSDTYLPTEKT